MSKTNTLKIEKAWSNLRQAKLKNDAVKMLAACHELEDALAEANQLVTLRKGDNIVRATPDAATKFRELGWKE